MALIRNCRLPIVIVAAATLSASLAWGQSTDSDSWQKKLPGNWCDAEHGCTHWWTLYEIVVTDDDVIAISHRDRLNTLGPVFMGTIQEPVGTWAIKLRMKGGPFDGREFDAAVSELGAVKAIIEGKFKGSVKAKIQAADIEGIIVNAKDEIATISDAKVDEPKIDKVTLDKVTIEKPEIKEPQTDGSVLKGAEQIKGEKLEASTLKAKKIAGKASRQVEISIPIQISEATIEGDAAPKGRQGQGEGGEDDDSEGSKRVEIKGKIKGKIATSKGEGELKGDFEAEFKWLVKAVIKGTFLVLPYECSEAGSPLSEEQRADLLQRPKAEVIEREGKATVSGEPGRFRSKIEQDEKEQLRAPKLKALGLLDAARNPRVVKPPLVVEAAKTRAPRPAEPHTRGKFMRKVSGTVSAIDPRIITLDLPPLPVLDHRCTVIDELPKRTLKLVKQHDAVR